MSQPSTRPAKRERVVLNAQVKQAVRLSPHMFRVVLTGPELSSFNAGGYADNYIKLLFPSADAKPQARTYTVRTWDPDALELTIDFVHHGHEGLAGPWAANAKVGDPLQLFDNAGGAYSPSADADWHLLVGDSSALPAIGAALGWVPPGVPVHVFIEVADEAEHQDLTSSGDAHITWLHNGGRSDAALLLEAVRALDFPAGSVQAFVHGEAASVRAVRRHLLLDRGVAREALSVSGYWKQGRTEEGWRADKADWNAQAEQDAPTR